METSEKKKTNLTKKQKEFLEYLNKRHEELKEEEDFFRNQESKKEKDK